MIFKQAETIVNFVPTGLLPTKRQNPNVPISPEDIIEQVLKACEVGITIVHLHAREAGGKPSQSPDIYAEIINGIRKERAELVICVSLSGRVCSDYEHRVAVLRLTGDQKPDMGSLTLSSMNFRDDTSINTPSTVRSLAHEMTENGIVPELEAFDAGMINVAKHLGNEGVILAPFYFNLIFGNIASSQMCMLQAGMLLNELPTGALWSFGGIGSNQLTANLLAVATGGGVRVGLEDNLYNDSARSVPASNIGLLERVKTVSLLADRPIMKPATFRKMMNMEPGLGRYGRKTDPKEVTP